MNPNRTFSFYIDPEIFELQDFDENCLWFLIKLVKSMSTADHSTTYSIAKLGEITKWGKGKVLQTTEQLIKLKLIEKISSYNPETKQNFCNIYKMTNTLVGFINFQNFLGQNFAVQSDEGVVRKSDKGLSENRTRVEEQEVKKTVEDTTKNEDEGVVRKSDKGLSENRTVSNTYLLPTKTDPFLDAQREVRKVELANFQPPEIFFNQYEMRGAQRVDLLALLEVFKADEKNLDSKNLLQTFKNWMTTELRQQAEEAHKLKVNNEVTDKIAEKRLDSYSKKVDSTSNAQSQETTYENIKASNSLEELPQVPKSQKTTEELFNEWKNSIRGRSELVKNAWLAGSVGMYNTKTDTWWKLKNPELKSMIDEYEDSMEAEEQSTFENHKTDTIRMVVDA